jgi:Transcriptional regulator, AbiEi antitoxin
MRLLDRQDGVITVSQAVSAGMTSKSVRDQVRAGRWQVMHRGVYAAFTGKPERRAELWGVLLRLGPDAVLSHQSAAELWGLLNGPSAVIHVTVPYDSNPDRLGKIGGVVVHRSRSGALFRHCVQDRPHMGTSCTQ